MVESGTRILKKDNDIIIRKISPTHCKIPFTALPRFSCPNDYTYENNEQQCRKEHYCSH